MDKKKILIAFYFGVVAHFALPIGATIIGFDNPHPVGGLDILGYSSVTLVDPVFWSGAIWGYFFGGKVCSTNASEPPRFRKGVLIGLLIPLLSSATLGLFSAITQFIEGKATLLIVAFIPIGFIFMIAIFTLGTIYLIGIVAALVLQGICWKKAQLTNNSRGT
jgi:hypothetical protein